MAIDRRTFLGGAAAVAGTFALPKLAHANAAANAYFNGYEQDNGYQYRRTNLNRIDPVWRRQMVKYFSPEPPGTVVVDTRNHFLYWIWENNTALRYGVGVGREGFKWYGRARIDRKALWPRWVPPPEMLKRQPELPRRVEGGAANNPLGPRALYLYNNGSDTGYRLHGTLEPWSIGHDVSSGCIRMLPEDIIDLYQRCPKGTAVLVLEHLGASAG
ncbi:L,D-transpeptidase [Roseibium sp. HPY-6]|uniref:L,D-transpeptidase n=1 Tax=Roseibium sp. HPY-6 TaxID=3229852 RepID=UPI003390119C